MRRLQIKEGHPGYRGQGSDAEYTSYYLGRLVCMLIGGKYLCLPVLPKYLRYSDLGI